MGLCGTGLAPHLPENASSVQWETIIPAEIPNKYLIPHILSTVSICTDDGANVVKTA